MNSESENYKKLWDTRYGSPEFAYGKLPNQFFKERLDPLPSGNILLPAEGEGRNAVYAASKGWKVTAFDLSDKGKEKAEKLADEYNLSFHYLIGDLEQFDFEKESFDIIGFIYAHFLSEKKAALHRKLNTYLKRGGIIIFEAFGKKNLPLVKANPKVGGAMPESMLFSTEELKEDFSNYEILLLEEKEIVLSEGLYHNGTGSVIRFVGRKL
ncbi:bifunctional 2-polyprenyl-6-hydroxyphenol methylase/3-demethylubiquinol 3-O-methyltransferase UbiG [Chryseobacterium sp. EO14]|uniref:class I SAM-dependent methyltransferase n=1 Tax=Chryseobacterium sp. EO14 TaxID=2950551 RepID=UPI00210F1614|nr:class I SAM-dependent methyltransferase [Chryseobacterium sp. EO14]MCQ4141900.1 class I SAM-dependent methyltransferase [Chryseobacterium sp. EO14]